MAELFDIVVRRQIYIEGLKASKNAEWAATLQKLRVELANRLSGFQFDELGNATKTALRSLITDLRKIARTIFDPYLKALIDWLQRFMRVDGDLLARVYGDAAPEAREALETVDPDRLWALALAAPLAATGTLALPFLSALLPSLYVKLERLTLQHYASHETKAALINAIAGPANTKEPQGLIRQLNAQGAAATNTIIQHLASQSNEAFAAKVAGVYEWVSVLDDRTTKICISRDGKRYIFGRGPIPPAHIGCRSTIVPVRPGDPPTPNSFSEWLSGQSDEFVADALDGRRGARYDRASPLSLNEYGAKSNLIGF